MEGNIVLDFHYFQLISFGLLIVKERLVSAVAQTADPRFAAFFGDSAQDLHTSDSPRERSQHTEDTEH